MSNMISLVRESAPDVLLRAGREVSSFLNILLVPATLAGIVAFAQIQLSTLVGTVRDSAGAIIPRARVTVVNTDTQFRSETITSAEGSYYVPYLSPGVYQITVEASGFRRAVHDGVIIRTGETPRVDIDMEVGAMTEAVQVSAQSPLLATDTVVVGQIMESDALAHVQAPQEVRERVGRVGRREV